MVLSDIVIKCSVLTVTVLNVVLRKSVILKSKRELGFERFAYCTNELMKQF